MRAQVLALTACLVCLSAAAAPAEVVGYWPCDEEAGLLALDHAPGGSDAMLHNVERVAGRDGGGLRLGGADSDSYLVIPDGPDILPPGGFTVQLWWEKTQRQAQILFRKGRPGSRFTAYAYYEGELRFQTVDREGQQFGIAAAAPGEGWHHLGFTCGAGQMAIIVDGETVASGPAPAALYRDDVALLVGTYSPGYRWCLAGTLDDLCISDEALAPDELDAELARARALAALAARVRDFPAEQGGIVLAQDGAPGATIVIAEDATPLQLEPALELRKVVAQATGARLPLAYDGEAPDGSVVLVGESALTRALDLPELTGDEYLIRAEPGRLVLLGHDALLQDDSSAATDPMRSKRGTSNAVEAFLRDVCGVRRFMPGRLGEIVPAMERLEVPAIDRRGHPWRTYSLGSLSRDEPWARQHLMGSTVFIRHRGGHLWYSLIPEAEHFAEHPEWFALRDGARLGEGNHLCTTNPEMRAAALAQLRAIYDQGFEWVELGQTDGYRRCQCEECEAQDEYRTDGWWVPGVPADRIHLFHDWLAQEIARSHPDRTLLIISYGPTGEVPHAIDHFGANVAVEFTHSPQSLVDRWTAWHERFTAYVYWWGLYQRMGFGPKSSTAYVASEVRRMVEAGVEAFYLCGGGECWSTEAPGYYVYSRLQEDPTLDPEALVDEFCAGLFGPAAGTMREYFGLLDRAAERYRELTAFAPVEGEPFMGPRLPAGEICAECYPAEWLDRSRVLLYHALDEEADTEAIEERVRYFIDGLEYLMHTRRCYETLARWQQHPSEETMDAHRQAMQRREAHVWAFQHRDGIRAGDLPPAFDATREVLLRGPRDLYADLYRPLEE